MLLSTSLTIAYKCPSCGKFEFFNTSLFKVFCIKEFCMVCCCGKSHLKVSNTCAGEHRIAFPCIGCGEEHIFLLKRKNLFIKNVNILHCPVTGIQQCFIGNDEEVRKRIDNLEKEYDELINNLGYDSYFVNTQVMLESLNTIHDLAETGNLYCECGNEDIELVLLPDKIYLKCKDCQGSGVISAASNKDLKILYDKKQIVLFNNRRKRKYLPKNFMRKTDDK